MLLLLVSLVSASIVPSLSQVRPSLPVGGVVHQRLCVTTDECCHLLFPGWASAARRHQEAVFLRPAMHFNGPMTAGFDDDDEVPAADINTYILQSMGMMYTKSEESDFSQGQFHCADMRKYEGFLSPDVKKFSTGHRGPWTLQCQKGYLLQDYKVVLGNEEPKYTIKKGACVRDSEWAELVKEVHKNRNNQAVGTPEWRLQEEVKPSGLMKTVSDKAIVGATAVIGYIVVQVVLPAVARGQGGGQLGNLPIPIPGGMQGLGIPLPVGFPRLP